MTAASYSACWELQAAQQQCPHTAQIGCHLRAACPKLQRSEGVAGWVTTVCMLAAQAKRTNIGIALITHPRVLFLDEPTSGLDSYTAHEVSDPMCLPNGNTKQGQSAGWLSLPPLCSQ